MNMEVANLDPAIVWTHFEQLNAVPRPSKQEERVIAFMKSFGEALGFETIVDSVGNVVIKKPATPGREDRQTVILQSHLDMVHQKNTDTDFDFQTQGIESYIDGEWVKAKGTTLGADNGMGAASMMAVLASTDIEHGPIECLFTIDEETGMTGAQNIDQGLLTGKILINTDTEDEGELCIGCAGGVDTTVTLKYEKVAVEDASQLSGFKVSVTGLMGGHSGCEIHLGRGNANKIMNRLLQATEEEYQTQIISIHGGSLRNAIPRESFATVTVPSSQSIEFQQAIAKLFGQIQQDYQTTDPEMVVKIEPFDEPLAAVMDPASQQQFLAAVATAPNGVHKMSEAVSGLVETSTNLSKVELNDGQASIQFLTRSSVEVGRDELAGMIQANFERIGATVEHAGSYPGWEPNADSDIKRLMIGVYEDLYGSTPIVNAVHAGLECGILGSRYPGMDMISFGPTIKHPHSPDEKCHIPSVKKYWDYLLAVLEKIPG